MALKDTVFKKDEKGKPPAQDALPLTQSNREGLKDGSQAEISTNLRKLHAAAPTFGKNIRALFKLPQNFLSYIQATREISKVAKNFEGNIDNLMKELKNKKNEEMAPAVMKLGDAVADYHFSIQKLRSENKMSSKPFIVENDVSDMSKKMSILDTLTSNLVVAQSDMLMSVQKELSNMGLTPSEKIQTALAQDDIATQLFAVPRNPDSEPLISASNASLHYVNEQTKASFQMLRKASRSVLEVSQEVLSNLEGDKQSSPKNSDFWPSQISLISNQAASTSQVTPASQEHRTSRGVKP